MKRPIMNDESGVLREELTKLYDSYNGLVADKDAIDVRLGSREPYAEARPGIDLGHVYEVESKSLVDDIRETVIKMMEVGDRLKGLEGC
jgi:hypothetical protein